jgi:fatty acid desaturase
MATVANHPAKALSNRQLLTEIKQYRQIDNWRNLAYIAQEWITGAAVLAVSIYLLHNWSAWGLHWAGAVGVWFVGVLLIGVVQHRLAGLGHEGAHYILFRNRHFNELASDLFCMFPLFATTEQYRLIHLGHHQYVNDWDKDPELTNLGKTRMMDQFPMRRRQFIYNFFVKLFWPPNSLRYIWDNIYVTVLGKGVHPYPAGGANEKAPEVLGFRLTSLLGFAFLIGLVAALRLMCVYFPETFWLQLAVPAAAWLGAVGIVYAMPESWYFRSPLKKQVFSSRFVSVFRLGFYVVLMTGLSIARFQTGTDWALYFWLLWVVPLFTSFPYYMLIRDIFQHANADEGRFTNSRVFFTGPVTRWAFFVYGQDIHVTHHLFSGIPHYRLPALHKMLMEENDEYREQVIECHGIFANHGDHPTAIDVMTPGYHHGV